MSAAKIIDRMLHEFVGNVAEPFRPVKRVFVRTRS